MICPHCNQEIDDKEIARHLASKGGRKGGRSTSPAKQAASRRNAKLGGRPKKEKK
jgi:hypothetical protein